MELVVNKNNDPVLTNEVEIAYNRLPFSKPGDIMDFTHGSSYVWATYNDKKINSSAYKV